MTFVLTPDQEALRATVERSFTDLCTSTFIRSLAEKKESYQKVWELVSSLGLAEYFHDKSIPLTDLALISYEGGKVLLPSVIVESLYFGPFAMSHCASYPNSDLAQRICLGIQTDKATISFIADSSATYVVALHPFAESVKALRLMLLANSSQHSCLDLTRQCVQMPDSEGKKIEDSDAQALLFGFMVLVAAELSGVAAKAIKMTRDYVLTRKQFGVEIGSFQAVQQQLAESFLKAEGMWALTQFAASVYTNDPDQLPLAARSALSFAIKYAPLVCETALQLHGGIGFTWEYDMHLYLRRAHTLASLFALGESDERAILEDAVRI